MKCEHCGVKLESDNTSVISQSENLCQACEHKK